jgi:hypothetical protein
MTIRGGHIELGAATWREPDAMCLDEPTSASFVFSFQLLLTCMCCVDYLDREPLAAHILALKVFEGGVATSPSLFSLLFT